MTEELRSWLYPLGFLSSLLFGARFILQWLQSERKGASIVTPLFWQISLAGNSLLALHAFIQIQYHVCIVQACNCVIAWRNLDLMQAKHPPVSFNRVILYLLSSFLLTTAAFLLQDFFFFTEWGDWFHTPSAPWQDKIEHPIAKIWHIIGFVGYVLFSSRFWIQWWWAEQAHVSLLPSSFWWMSLIGALLSILYFNHIQDPVNLIGPLIGLIPYVRNLMLIYKSQPAPQGRM